MTLASGLYTGLVSHNRVKPRRHKLAYRIFMLLIDLDELDSLKLKTLGVRTFNLFGFDERRFGDGSDRPLKAQIEAALTEAGIECGGPVRMLAMPQILGRAFNPLTVYFCHDKADALTAILYEVNNTFGERHAYLIPAPNAALIRQNCAKGFYVSPFMDMDMTYNFVVRPPADEVSITVRGSDAQGTLITANFTGTARPLTDRTILATVLRYPLLALKVVGGIHWEALKMLAKGLRLRDRPPPPAEPITVVRAPG